MPIKPGIKKSEFNIGFGKQERGLLLKAALGLLLVAALAVFFWQAFFTGKGVEFAVNAPNQVMSGKVFPLEFAITNGNKQVLSNSKLILELPQGCLNQDFKEISRLEIPLGNIGKGGSRSQKERLAVLGNSGDVKHFKAILSWKAPGFKVSFQRQKEFDVLIEEPVVSLGLSLPKRIISGTPFNFEVTYRDNLPSSVKGLVLKIKFPPEYVFKQSEPNLENPEAINIPLLSASRQERVVLTGKITGKEKQFFAFSAEIGFQKGGNFFVLDRKEGRVSLSSSLLPIDVTVNGGKDYVARVGDSLVYTIKYSNEAEVALSDVIVKARLDGELFNFSSIETDGYFNAKDRTIVWNAGNHPELRLIGASEEGSVSFKVKLKDGFPLNEPNKKNFVLKVKSEIESLSVPYYVAASRLVNSSEIETKVAGKADFQCSSFFRDAKSGFLNNGPWPPRAGEATDFTIHLKLVNYSTDIKDVKIKATLGNGVSFPGRFKRIGNFPAPEYNQRTNEITLNIPEVKAWEGVATTPWEIILQVSLLPSVNQIGSGATLLKDISFQAKDSFSGLTLLGKCDNMGTIDIYHYDRTVSLSEGIVQK